MIVALTSWKPRLPYVHIAINSILNGSTLPHKIVLTLFCKDIPFITEDLQNLINEKKVELLVCNEDLGCAKRWYYVMQKYPDDSIILVDDDIVYPKNFLRDLSVYSEKYPNTIICRWGRPIIFNSINSIQPFLITQKQYHFIKNDLEPSFLHHFICGAGGTLFPPHSINCNDVDIDTINKYKQIDEVLLKYLSLKNNIKTKIIPYNDINEIFRLIQFREVRKCSLWNLNRNTNNLMHNDVGYRDLLIPEFQRLYKNYEYNKPIITIVIPCYNPIKEKFDRCINSILNQYIGINNLAITIVNDGSTDNTVIEYIKNKYVYKYLNISIVELESNQGPGNARNKGLEACNTKYITFMDYDDCYVDNTTLVKVIQHLEFNPNCEFLIGGRKNIVKGDEILYPNIKRDEIATIIDKKNLILKANLVSPQSKVYRTSFLKNNDIRFTNLRSAQDRLFYYTAVVKAKAILEYNSPIFLYDDSNNGNRITNTHNNTVLNDCIECDLKLIELFDRYAPELSRFATNNIQDIIRRYKLTENIDITVKNKFELLMKHFQNANKNKTGNGSEKFLLCAMCKLENNYLNEWITYHLNLGFDKIVLIDNNDTEGEFAENIYDVSEVRLGVSNGTIEVVPLHNGKYLQQIQYQKVYNKYRKDFDWFCFLDIDEFLTLTDTDNIKDFVSLPQFEDYNAIRLCWKCYGDNELVKVKDNNYSVLNRFVTPSFNQNSTIVKTLFRSFKDEEILFPTSHGPLSVSIRSCNAEGKPLRSPQNYSINLRDVTHKHGYIKHFVTKTLEEFIKKKIPRGGSAQSQLDINSKYGILNFFSYNRVSKKYQDYLQEIGYNKEFHKTSKINNQLYDQDYY